MAVTAICDWGMNGAAVTLAIMGDTGTPPSRTGGLRSTRLAMVDDPSAWLAKNPVGFPKCEIPPVAPRGMPCVASATAAELGDGPVALRA